MIKRLLFVALTATCAPVGAQVSPVGQRPAGADPVQQITVTGIRVQDYRDRLAQCLARHCPVNEDVDATMALAEALFINGDYHGSRTAILASLHRNRNQAAAFPEPVSDLWRANARVARNLGMDQDAERSTRRILRALRAGIPAEDYRHFTARFEISEMEMRRGDFPRAREALVALEAAARAGGRADVATMAHLRLLSFQNIVYPNADARREIERLAALTDPADRMEATGANILLSRIYRDEGNRVAANALLAEIGRASAGNPRRALLNAPHYQLAVGPILTPEESVQEMLDGSRSVLLTQYTNLSDNFEDKWIDVGFWIQADGHVSDVEVMRRSANPDWADPLLESIQNRVYSAGPEPTYRLERYTYTAPLQVYSGSRIPQRTRNARVEFLDLTTGGDAPPPPSPEAPAGPSPV